jgi:hypothetical protein
MQEDTLNIEIDMSKLPKGTTAQEVHEAITGLMSDAIGDQERPGVSFEFERALLGAIVEPPPPPKMEESRAALRELNAAELAYLHRAATGHGVNDWMGGWAKDKPVREKLEGLKLVKTQFHPRTRMAGDVDSTWCKATDLGREVLQRVA